MARRFEAPLSQPEKARHFFRAEMPHEIVLGDEESIEVTISLEDLAVAAGRAGVAGAAKVDTARKLIIDVRPRAFFEVVEESRRVELEPLQPGDPEETVYFDVRATDVGQGEIDVVIRQGQVPLVALKLEPVVVAQSSGRTQRTVAADIAVADAPRLKGPINELTIWEQKNHGETRLKFQFRSPELGIRASDATDVIEGGIEAYVAGVYENIEDRWNRRSHTPETFTKDLKAIGMTMFEQLVPTKIGELLWKHREKLTSIQILSDEPYLPWEIVHLKASTGKTTGDWFLGQMGLVRWLENLDNNGFGPEHLEIKKALAIIPDYPPDTEWQLDEPALEFDYLKKKMGAQKVPSTRIDVDAILETPGSFDLLHYAGHGQAPTESSLDASLILAVSESNGEWLTEELDADTVAHFAELTSNGERPMVVLNACQVGRMRRRLGGTGGFAKAFLSNGAGVFISSLWAVGDEPARSFVEAFYDSIATGAMVSEATIAAREKARDDGDFTWLAYTVYANPHATISIG